MSYYYGDNVVKSDIVQRVEEARLKAAMVYNKQMLKLFTFESNCDLSDIEIVKDLSICDSALFNSFIQEDGVEKGRLLFFDPFASDEDCLDIHLRHELRHCLTSSVRSENGVDIVKVGNAEYQYKNGELLTIDNEFYNELITQRRAIDYTKESFQRGIYILSPSGVAFPSGFTSDYDTSLSEFDKLFCLLPSDALHSQIELNNDNLYSFISQDEIKQLEEGLYRNNIPEDILNSIKNRITGGVPFH